MARPSHKPTTAMRRKVSVSAAAGMTHEEIAIAIGITKPTLYKHYESELSVGALRRRMDVLDCMHRTAMKGNVAAQKAFVALTPSLAAPPLGNEKPAPPLGKKDQANVDAVGAQAGTDWDGLLPGANVTPIRKAS